MIIGTAIKTAQMACDSSIFNLYESLLRLRDGFRLYIVSVWPCEPS
jgi:hypothetical protein